MEDADLLPVRSLKGKTLVSPLLYSAPVTCITINDIVQFISGASRGIGLAIALRAAKDGANIVCVYCFSSDDATSIP